MRRGKKPQAGLALCLQNEGYRASLEVRKLYKVLPDSAAAAQHLLRIVDESGQDYLYPEEFFVRVRLAREIAQALRLAS